MKCTCHRDERGCLVRCERHLREALSEFRARPRPKEPEPEGPCTCHRDERGCLVYCERHLRAGLSEFCPPRPPRPPLSRAEVLRCADRKAARSRRTQLRAVLVELEALPQGALEAERVHRRAFRIVRRLLAVESDQERRAAILESWRTIVASAEWLGLDEVLEDEFGS
jgi:hypothetical protein